MLPMPVALVTGATEGIGRATAFALGRAGYAVAVTARTQTKLEGLLTDLRRAGIRAWGRSTDVADPEGVAAVVAGAERELGPIDALVNNAGVAISGPLVDMKVEEWDRIFATNVRGLFLMTRAVLPGMLARRAGDIINIASLAAKNGVAQMAAYSASKHAVLGFSRSLMLEVRKEGVRVIAICPGSVETPLLRRLAGENPKPDRVLQPGEVAEAVIAALALPRRALVSELDIRPTNP